MYTRRNFRTKKELKAALAAGEEIRRALIYHSAHRDDADDAFAREEHE